MTEQRKGSGRPAFVLCIAVVVAFVGSRIALVWAQSGPALPQIPPPLSINHDVASSGPPPALDLPLPPALEAPPPVTPPAGTWTKVTNLAPASIGTMLLLTDGTVMAQQGSSQNWMRLSPDFQGSYINGTWSQNISPMGTRRLYFGSNVMPNGKVFVLGGEYSGPALLSNWSATGEVYDPVSNTWSAIASYPNQNSCPIISTFTGSATAGSSVMPNIPTTSGFQSGWTITSTAVPANTTILTVDSTTQIHMSQNALSTAAASFTLSLQLNGDTTSGSNIIANLPSTANLLAGFTITGAGIPASTTLTSIDSSTQIHISHNATATAAGVALTFGVQIKPPSCFGDDPTMLLPNGKILAGDLLNASTYIYDPTGDTWTTGPNKFYNDRSDEEGWGRIANGSIITYDLFQSVSANSGYAERYDPVANTWSGISPVDATASGTLPVLSSNAVGFELGPVVRLFDDRIFVIGANGHTALYTPSTNTWAAGPDSIGTLGGVPFLFAADDAPAAIMPDGHVIFAADAGLGLTAMGNTTVGSKIITGIPSTAALQSGWPVAGTGIPGGSTISSIDSATQIHISQNALATNTGIPIKFGGAFQNPTQLFDFDPGSNTITSISSSLPDTNLSFIPSFVTRLLMLPTGQLLFSDSSNQAWIYTRSDSPDPSWMPTITNIAYDGTKYTLMGTQLSGQSAGSTYGDDVESDENYPIVLLTSAGGNVYYARTTNWSYVGVGGGATPQTVNFTLPNSVPAGTYSLTVSAAGISSVPFPFTPGQGSKRRKGQTISE